MTPTREKLLTLLRKAKRTAKLPPKPEPKSVIPQRFVGGHCVSLINQKSGIITKITPKMIFVQYPGQTESYAKDPNNVNLIIYKHDEGVYQQIPASKPKSEQKRLKEKEKKD